jgi:Flp pilus assembly pilin Flp
MKASLTRVMRDTSGQDIVEYGLLIGIITVALVASIRQLPPIVAGYYSYLISILP